MTATAVEQQIAEVEEHLVDVLNHGALAVMLSIGHRTGMLDALAERGAQSSAELAAATGLHERYVREWLGAVSTGRIVDLDPDSGNYRLRPEVSALVTRQGSANLAVFAQYISQMGAVEDKLLRCFREGGGLGYEHFPRFHEVMAEDSAQTVLAALESDILPLVPGLPDRLSTGIEVLDVGCGRGRAVNQLASTYPNSRFTGIDISTDAVEYARAEAKTRGHRNVTFAVRDAATLVESMPSGSFDLVTTFDAVHDQAAPDAVLRGIRHVLRDDGVYLAQDIDSSGSHHGDLDHPLGSLLYALSLTHCMTVSLAAGGAGLGTMWGRPLAERYLQAAGFANVQTHTLPHDAQNAYYVCHLGRTPAKQG